MDVGVFSPTSGDVVFTLPSWAWPNTQLRFPCATGTPVPGSPHVDIATNGDVQFWSSDTALPTWVALHVTYSPNTP